STPWTSCRGSTHGSSRRLRRTIHAYQSRPAKGDRRFASQLRGLLPVFFGPGHVGVCDEMVGVGAPEHEHLDGVFGLGSPNEETRSRTSSGPKRFMGGAAMSERREW